MAHFRIMYIHILLLYIQYWCLHAQCFYFFSSECLETNGEGLDQSETATQRWGGLTAHLIGWSSSSSTHTHTRADGGLVEVSAALGKFTTLWFVFDREAAEPRDSSHNVDLFCPGSDRAELKSEHLEFFLQGFTGRETFGVCLEIQNKKKPLTFTASLISWGFVFFFVWSERKRTVGSNVTAAMTGNGGVYAVKRRKKPVQKM